MDIGSHFLSGVVISMLTPPDPDPEKDFWHRVLIFAGAMLPDLPVPLIWRSIARRIKKSSLGSIVAHKLTLDDYENHAEQASPWIQFYKFTHSWLYIIKSIIFELIFCGNLYATWGLLVHQIYDLFTHKFKNENLNPKPLYPLSNWTWKWGIPSPWGFQDYFILSWMAHGLIMLLILSSGN